MSDQILLFLAMDVAALLLLGTFAAVIPLAAASFLATAFCGLGTLLCLPPLLLRMQATALTLPVGPPGLSMHLALDPLSTVFLAIVFLAGTAIAAFQAKTVPLTRVASVRVTAFCLAGTVFSLIAADGFALAIGLAITCGTIGSGQRQQPTLLIPLLVLVAACLLTPSGFAPRFDAIRAAPVDPGHATAAAALTFVAAAGLAWPRSEDRCWSRDALTAGVLIPSAAYLILRLVVDLCGAAGQAWWGFILLLVGGSVAIFQGWRSAAHPDIDTAVAALIRRQAGIVMIGGGLALIARAADLLGAASFALEAVFLAVIGGSLAGTLTSLAAQAIGASAGTYRLSRLGGLVHLMPGTSAALAAGILILSALPPGLGFASLWLLFQSILSAPRTGGLLSQLPLALIAAALAVSAALATAASVRLIGIAALGRPRTPRGSGAQESKSPLRAILLTLGGLSLLAGVLPGAALWLVADPAIHALIGIPVGGRTGLALLSISSSSPSYLALPVLVLLMLTIWAVMLVPRWSRKEGKAAGIWLDGMAPPVGLPFGEPAAQSAGAGFLPTLPDIPLTIRWTIPWTQFQRLSVFTTLRPPSAATGVWLVLAAFVALLLALVVTG